MVLVSSVACFTKCDSRYEAFDYVNLSGHGMWYMEARFLGDKSDSRRTHVGDALSAEAPLEVIAHSFACRLDSFLLIMSAVLRRRSME